MKIGIIAWGSLVYDWDTLKIENDKWFNDGPELPIEFARISGNKKLTLVIYPAFDKVKTHYSISSCNGIDEAIKNLAERERTNSKNIGYINFKTGELKSKKMEAELKKVLSIWNIPKNLDGMIWTDLDENFMAELKQQFSLETSIKYLDSLSQKDFLLAKEYIIKAPNQTQTRNRELLFNFINSKKA